MLKFEGELCLFQNDDCREFAIHRVPNELIARTRLFLRNQWTRDGGEIPAVIRERMGFLNPILDPIRVRAGRPLARRTPRVVFFGVRTGRENLADGGNSRERAIRLIRAASIPFDGGLVQHPAYGELAPELTVTKLSKLAHRRLLEENAISLCPWGNSPLAYRLFEGLAHRNLVVAQSLAKIEFIDCGLKPGVHYVEVAADLSDLVEKVNYYLEHLDEAQTIADAGNALFASKFAFRGIALNEPLFREVRSSWQGILETVGHPGWMTQCLRPLLPHVSNLPSI